MRKDDWLLFNVKPRHSSQAITPIHNNNIELIKIIGEVLEQGSVAKKMSSGAINMSSHGQTG